MIGLDTGTNNRIDTKNAFNCTMCGQCCQGDGGIVATIEEQKAMAQFLNLSLTEFQDIYIRQSGQKYFVQTDEHGLCLLFVQDKGCLAHPVKPKTCMAWPFFRGNLMDESSFEMAREYCSGINPQVSFEDFVAQGICYLKENNLSTDTSPSPANALNIQGIK
ncbi:MAG: YkgJ family cysteine cluster protein [Desulfonatronovibrio sp. MSAO_Bac4]|nr:MAG: YkgJ family cysteine cluster protein [Desulfonatronovibrio sp. MSAO_Bac4]